MKLVYVSKLDQKFDLQRSVLSALEWIRWDTIVKPDARVFVKPNLTWPDPTPGVTVTPEFIEAVVAALYTRTRRIVIGESDGGYHSFAAEEAFEKHGLYAIAERYGIKVVNLSRLPSEHREVAVNSRNVTIELPSLLLHDIDVFITLPVPKLHAMTGVSLAFKNQWGCIPNIMRLRNHAQFPEKIVAINKLLKPGIALFDGTYFLDKNGPMIGEPVRMDLLIAANDIGAGSWVCCELMHIDPNRVKHFRVARKEGLFPERFDEIVLNQPIERMRGRPFRLKRNLANWIALAAFNHPWGTKVLYDSVFAAPIHWLLYTVRRNPFIGRLLYGESGPPKVEGKPKKASKV